MNKSIALLICLASLFVCANVYAEPIIKAAKDSISPEVIEHSEDIPAAVSMDPAEVKAVYTDGKSIKAVLIKSSYAPESLKVGESVYSCSQPDDKGYIYVYTDEEYTEGDVAVSVDGITSTFAPVDIVKAKDKWQTSEDGHTLVAYMGSSKDMVIPNFYNGEIITAVGEDRPLENGDTVESAVFPDGIIDIGNYVFYKKKALSSVTLADSIETIGGAAFADSGLSCDIAIPENTRIIYAYAFMNSGITSVKLNDRLERLCSYSFAGCKNMGGTIELPSSLSYLGDWVFEECARLTGGITIPAGVKTVGDGAFFNCTLMTGKIVLEEGVEEIGLGSFGADSTAKSGFTAVELPGSLKKIGPYAFQLAGKIEYLELPEGLETISDGAFDHMSGLTNEKLVIPSTVRTIGGDYNVEENTGYGGHVFYDMGKNETFKAIETAEGNQYFTSVDGVLYDKDITRLIGYPRGRRDSVYEIPEGVTQLDELCFSRAAYLNKIVLPDSYIISETVPENVLNKDGNSLAVALYVYTAVNYVDVKPTNENYVSENGIIYSKDKKSLWYIPKQYSGDINVDSETQSIEKGSVFIASKSNTKWGNMYLPQAAAVNRSAAEYIWTFMRGFFYGTDGENAFLYGDVNCDNKTDKADAFVMLKNVSGIQDGHNTAADYNLDGKTDITDVIALLQAK